MRKLVVKTVLLTVGAFICVLAIIFGALSLACPNKLAGAFDAIGSYKANVYFMQKQYEKTGEFDDLISLIKELDENKSPAKTAEYCEILFDDLYKTAFDEYCKNDGKTEYLTETNAKEFFYDKYAVAEINTGDVDSAIEIAKKCVSICGYTKTNPFRSFINMADELTPDELNKIKQGVNGVSLSDSTQKQIRTQDINDITEIINRKNTEGE